MTDQLTGLPAADWYTDPSDPASERWWGGLEWTNHTRPLDVAPPAPAPPQFALPVAAAPQVALPAAAAPQIALPAAAAPAPQLALQPAVPAPIPVPVPVPVPASAFAAQLVAAAPSLFETQPAAPAFSPSQFSSAEEASEVASWVGGLDASTGSPWENRTPAPAPAPSAAFVFGTPAEPAQPEMASVPAQRTHHVKKQSNTPALVGFLLSLLGLGLISLIVSVRGARRASRYEAVGDAPTGRVLARWGIALSIIEMIIGLIAGALFAYSYFFAGSVGLLDDLIASGSGGSSSETTTVSDTTTADQPAVAAVPSTEKIAAGMAGSMVFFYGVEAESVVCPPDAPYTPGSVVTCDIVLTDGRQLSGVQTFTDHGYSTEYIAK